MKQIKNEHFQEVLGVEEYLDRRKELREKEIKKEQENFPEPFSYYSSFLLLSL